MSVSQDTADADSTDGSKYVIESVKEEMLDEVRDFLDADGVPKGTKEDFDDQGDYTTSAVENKLDMTWTEVILLVGGDPPWLVTQDDIREAIQTLVEERGLDRAPTTTEYRESSKTTALRKVYEFYDGWDEAVEDAGFEPDTKPSPGGDGIPEDAMLAELCRLHAEHGAVSPTIVDEYGTYGLSTYNKHFEDGVSGAAERAGIET